MPRQKKNTEEKMLGRKTTQPHKMERDEDPREEEWFHLPHCMDCGRAIPVHMKNFTVKLSNGLALVVCPICASKPGIRLKTPYISYDGLEEIRLMGGE